MWCKQSLARYWSAHLLLLTPFGFSSYCAASWNRNSKSLENFGFKKVNSVYYICHIGSKSTTIRSLIIIRSTGQIWQNKIATRAGSCLGMGALLFSPSLKIVIKTKMLPVYEFLDEWILNNKYKNKPLSISVPFPTFPQRLSSLLTHHPSCLLSRSDW